MTHRHASLRVVPPLGRERLGRGRAAGKPRAGDHVAAEALPQGVEPIDPRALERRVRGPRRRAGIHERQERLGRAPIHRRHDRPSRGVVRHRQVRRHRVGHGGHASVRIVAQTRHPRGLRRARVPPQFGEQSITTATAVVVDPLGGEERLASLDAPIHPPRPVKGVPLDAIDGAGGVHDGRHATEGVVPEAGDVKVQVLLARRVVAERRIGHAVVRAGLHHAPARGVELERPGLADRPVGEPGGETTRGLARSGVDPQARVHRRGGHLVPPRLPGSEGDHPFERRRTVEGRHRQCAGTGPQAVRQLRGGDRHLAAVGQSRADHRRRSAFGPGDGGQLSQGIVRGGAGAKTCRDVAAREARGRGQARLLARGVLVHPQHPAGGHAPIGYGGGRGVLKHRERSMGVASGANVREAAIATHRHRASCGLARAVLGGRHGRMREVDPRQHESRGLGRIGIGHEMMLVAGLKAAGVDRDASGVGAKRRDQWPGDAVAAKEGASGKRRRVVREVLKVEHGLDRTGRPDPTRHARHEAGPPGGGPLIESFVHPHRPRAPRPRAAGRVECGDTRG